jgi:hypothetical protein
LTETCRCQDRIGEIRTFDPGRKRFFIAGEFQSEQPSSQALACLRLWPLQVSCELRQPNPQRIAMSRVGVLVFEHSLDLPLVESSREVR